VKKRRLNKQEREDLVFLGLIELYLKTGAPIGSNTLKDCGFEFLSSATIRNYFGKLENEGFLKRHHISGGAIPTAIAFRKYADFCLQDIQLEEKDDRVLQESLKKESNELSTYLQKAAELLSKVSHSATLLSAPRFDQDSIHDVKIVSLDKNKLLCVLMTTFGLIRTETLYSPIDLEEDFAKKMEQFFLWRIGKIEKPKIEDNALYSLITAFYNEIMVRHAVGYSSFATEDLYRTGLSRLLNYPEFSDPANLALSLSLFEDSDKMRLLLKECMYKNQLCYWIGEDLGKFGYESKEVSVIAIPYRINQIAVGAVAILGPMRLPYKRLFGTLSAFSEYVSENLTNSLYKFKITFRQPSERVATKTLSHYKSTTFLEDKR
jgi:heat-inducible transcriptional repressor